MPLSAAAAILLRRTMATTGLPLVTPGMGRLVVQTFIRRAIRLGVRLPSADDVYRELGLAGFNTVRRDVRAIFRTERLNIQKTAAIRTLPVGEVPKALDFAVSPRIIGAEFTYGYELHVGSLLGGRSSRRFDWVVSDEPLSEADARLRLLERWQDYFDSVNMEVRSLELRQAWRRNPDLE